MSNALLGIAIVVVGAIINGSFTAPMKFILAHNHRNPWQWEHIWFLYSLGTVSSHHCAYLTSPFSHFFLTGYTVFTWLGAFMFIGIAPIIATYNTLQGSDLILPMFFAFGWGVGSCLLG